jgi:outer membrane protein TolC
MLWPSFVLLGGLVFTGTIAGAQAPAAERSAPKIRVSPQDVVDWVLANGLQAKAIELAANAEGLAVERALGDFDWGLNLSAGYEYNEGQSLNPGSNPLDRTSTFGLGVARRFTTGTRLSVVYSGLMQNSTLSSFTQSSRKPDIAQDFVQAEVRQSLVANAFGFADRLAVAVAQANVDRARLTRDEDLEALVLSVMQAYWQAYIAQEQLKSNLQARTKYEQLVANVRRKSGFNLSQPGELPRSEAELQSATARVKASSAAFLNSVDALVTVLKVQVKPGQDLEFAIPDQVPDLPRLGEKDVEKLRAIRSLRAQLQNAERNVDFVVANSRSTVDLVARAKSTGVADLPADSRAEMFSGRYPTFFLGVEARMAIDSSAVRAARAGARYQADAAKLSLESQIDLIKAQLRQTESQLAADFANARSSIATVELRERVVREFEASYRQGRTPLSELIRSYNELFAAQLERARSIGTYHISLNQMAALRDELIAEP